jgi:hypothetical protein
LRLATAFKKSERPDFRPAFAVIRFIRLHQGAQKGSATNLGSLSEPRRKQNPYANPKRTAKFSTTSIQTHYASERFKKISKKLIFFFFSNFATKLH